MKPELRAKIWTMDMVAGPLSPHFRVTELLTVARLTGDIGTGGLAGQVAGIVNPCSAFASGKLVELALDQPAQTRIKIARGSMRLRRPQLEQ